MQECEHYYFDNNIFWLLCKDKTGAKVNAFNQSLFEHEIVRSQKTVELLASPFTLLESISSPHKNLTPPQIEIPSALVDSGDSESIKDLLLADAKKYYAAQPMLKPEALLSAVKNQLNYGSDFGKKLFASVIAHNANNLSYEEYLYQALAFDYIQKFPYPEIIMRKMISSFAVDIFRSASYGFNISWARTISHMWNLFESKHLRTFDISLDDELIIQRDKYCFKRNSDYMDTEVTHFSTVGWNAGGALKPVVCFTSDPVAKVKFRVAAYKALIDAVSATFKGLTEEPPFKKVSMRPGYVAFCESNSGRVVEVLDVGNLSPEAVIF